MRDFKEYIIERAIEEGKYIVGCKSTIRATADHFCQSKSAVHSDLVVVLPEVDRRLADDVRQVLDYNREQRNIRGGQANKTRWKERNTKNGIF